jgi:hypothetical protein
LGTVSVDRSAITAGGAADGVVGVVSSGVAVGMGGSDVAYGEAAGGVESTFSSDTDSDGVGADAAVTSAATVGFDYSLGMHSSTAGNGVVDETMLGLSFANIGGGTSFVDAAEAAVDGTAAAAGGGRGVSLCSGGVGAAGGTANRAEDVIGSNSAVDGDAATVVCEAADVVDGVWGAQL